MPTYTLTIGGKTVKGINVLGGKDVKRISDINGNTLWEHGSGPVPPQPTPPVPEAGMFYIENLYPGSNTFSISFSDRPVEKYLEYSLDGGSTWTSASMKSFPSVTIPEGGKLYLRGDNSGWISGEMGSYIFELSNDARAAGEITRLLKNSDPGSVTSQGDYSMYYLFSGCSALKDVSGISFGNIASVSGYAMEGMFYGCTGIESTPSLKGITSVSGSAMSGMFDGCSSLCKAEAPFVSSWDASACSNWMRGVAASGDMFAKEGLTIPTGASGIPEGWTTIDR